MRYSPGMEAKPTITFVNTSGDLADPESVSVEIRGPGGTVIASTDDPERISPGFYTFTWLIPLDATLGLYEARWEAEIGGLVAVGEDPFEVESGGVVTPVDLQEIIVLRSRLAEPKPEGDADGTQTFFSDNTLQMMYAGAGGDLDEATLEGWMRKAAYYQQFYNVGESGSERQMSQKFRQAVAMVDIWRSVVNKNAQGRTGASLRGSVVGRPVNLRQNGYVDAAPLSWPFSGYSEHIRIFPTHRLMIPAILG